MAKRYSEGLAGVIEVPSVISGGVSVWAQYTVEHRDRDGLATYLKTKGVPTAAYYPVPMHRQSPYAHYPQPGGLEASDKAAGRVISLPMHAYLDEGTQSKIIEAIRSNG